MIIKLTTDEILALINYHSRIIVISSIEEEIAGSKIPVLISTCKRLKDLAAKFEISARKDKFK